MDNIEFYLYDLKTKFDKINGKDYYLSYSGGKDSHLLYWFIKEYLHNKDIEIIGLNTYLEHQEIKDRIYKYSDNILLPNLKPQEIKEKYGIPCFSKEQDFYIYYYQNAIRKGKIPAKTIQEKIDGTYSKGFSGISKKAREYIKSGNAHNITHLCCYYLKKKPFLEYEKITGKKAILGIKADESSLRKTQYKSCFTKSKKFTPLYDLTSKLEDEIIKRYNIEVPKIYNYIDRTGCMGCPYGSYKGDTEKELNLINENQRKYIINLFKKSYNILGIKM